MLTLQRRPCSVNVEVSRNLEAAKLSNQPEDCLTASLSKNNNASYETRLSKSTLVAWRPPTDWDILLPLPNEPSQDRNLPPMSGDLGGIAVAHSSLLELTRFQRFIRRMESAGPKIILDRLKEEWHDPGDEEADQELMLEKQLWVLTAFQLQNQGKLRTNPKPKANTGKLLELYGNLCESCSVL